MFLEGACVDRLLLFDCCYAAAAVTKASVEHTMEFLGACGREVSCRGPVWSLSRPGSLGGSAFTLTLIKYLKERSSVPNGLAITELQTLLTLDKNLDEQSPNHVIIQGCRRSLVLSPLEGADKPFTNTEAVDVARHQEDKVIAIIAISFKGDTPTNAERMAEYLAHHAPNDVGNIQVRNVFVQAIYDSWSTFVEAAVPLWLWARLPDIPGCSLVGFVKSGNQMQRYLALSKADSSSSWHIYSSANQVQDAKLELSPPSLPKIGRTNVKLPHYQYPKTVSPSEMADPISVASGMITLVGFAVQSTQSLYKTIRSFCTRSTVVRDVWEELEALGSVLRSLSEAVKSQSIELPYLKLPLLQCGNRL